MSAIFGETLLYGQHNGSAVELVTFGDEFYARRETKSGYSVIYDLSAGCYCYAELDQDGRFTSTGTPMAKHPPWGLAKHLRESSAVRRERFKASHAKMRPPEAIPESQILRTLGPNDGLLTGRRANNGDVRGLTILVHFADLECDIQTEHVEDMLNNPEYRSHGNLCSVLSYFRLMSAGKLSYTNDVVGPVKLSRKQSYYINHPLMEEALELAIGQYGVELSRYDSRQEGVVDALSFLYAGRTLYKNWLWPHNSVSEVRHGDHRTHYYTLQSMGRRPVDLSIGTFAHETGHMLCRFPDLYDYGNRDGDYEQSAGLGAYCLMSAGSHLGRGKHPSPVCAYLRDLAAWCDKEVHLDRPGKYTARHGDYGTVMRFRCDRPNEYFLIENRAKLGLDVDLPDGGLAIYHCDTRGSNELQDGTAERHYQCALLQADGHRDLETDVNLGDAGDLFADRSGIALSDTTNPASRTWRGADSGLVVREVGSAGEHMAFSCGANEQPGAETKTYVGGGVVDRIIPDNEKQGITEIAFVPERGKLVAIGVEVDITHNYRGDLRIELLSPTGTLVKLLEQRADPLNDVHLKLHSSTVPDLQELQGEPVAGEWKLTVKDLWPWDVGRLDRWSLVMDYAPDNQGLYLETNASAAIPDADAKGITSALCFDHCGRVSDIEVGVMIAHPWTGDLHIELIAPAGDRCVLRAPNGRPGKDLVASYNPATTPALKGLLGTQTSGEWTLRVRDLAYADTGSLEHFSLRLGTTSAAE